MARDEGIKTLAEKMIELIGKMDQELGFEKAQEAIASPMQQEVNIEKIRQKD